jgi:hypothetical protein
MLKIKIEKKNLNQWDWYITQQNKNKNYEVNLRPKLGLDFKIN